jgi:hypothetical protein
MVRFALLVSATSLGAIFRLSSALPGCVRGLGKGRLDATTSHSPLSMVSATARMFDSCLRSMLMCTLSMVLERWYDIESPPSPGVRRSVVETTCTRPVQHTPHPHTRTHKHKQARTPTHARTQARTQARTSTHKYKF